MEERFSALQGFYASGAIGINADGFLAVKDAANVPLKDRNQVNKLVAAKMLTVKRFIKRLPMLTAIRIG